MIMLGNYTKSFSEDSGELFTAEEYLSMMNDGCFYDDGYGHPMKDGKMDNEIYINPPSLMAWPEDATHIMWYNK